MVNINVILRTRVRKITDELNVEFWFQWTSIAVLFTEAKLNKLFNEWKQYTSQFVYVFILVEIRLREFPLFPSSNADQFDRYQIDLAVSI